MAFHFAAILLAFAGVAVRGILGQSLPSSSPHNYPGLPNHYGDFSDSGAWQKFFQVKDALPNVTYTLPRSYAGNLPVKRQKHQNNTLFFWGFERSHGSLTRPDHTEPWGIWLNGGPGASSMLGLGLENGPIHFYENFTSFKNPYSWNNALDMFWLDQPVGVGFSTADQDGYVADEDQMGRDFIGFLENLVQVFPNLKYRPLYLMGESYAGQYIPYIAKIYFSTPEPPVNLKKLVIGDGTYASAESFVMAPTVSVMLTYPQLIGFDPEVLKYFQEQSHLCKYDINLTYPQNGIIPPIIPPVPLAASARLRIYDHLRSNNKALRTALALTNQALRARDISATDKREPLLKRDLSNRPNGTIDPWYGCDIYDEMIDYALNFSKPWVGNSHEGFDVYTIPDALDPEAAPNPESLGVFLNDPRVVTAIHAPKDKKWVPIFLPESGYPFGNGLNIDPSPPTIIFFSDLLANMSSHNMTLTLLSGNEDSLVPHRGTEIAIQNMTFKGIQGFTKKPSTALLDQDGNFAGIIHRERDLLYTLFLDAGHLIPSDKPKTALYFLQQFILGDNPLGSVLPNGTVVGGTNSTLEGDVLPAVDAPIYTGSATTQGSFIYPSATIAAWEQFTSTARGLATHRLSLSSGSERVVSRNVFGEALLVLLGIVALVWG